MLVNRDQTSPHSVNISFDNAETTHSSSFAGSVRVVTFGSEQYVWHDDGPRSHADPDAQPLGKDMTSGSAITFTLPKASITVLRGKIGD